MVNLLFGCVVIGVAAMALHWVSPRSSKPRVSPRLAPFFTIEIASGVVGGTILIITGIAILNTALRRARDFCATSPVAHLGYG